MKKLERGYNYDGYNLKVKNKQKTRFGCIKPNCRAVLHTDELQTEISIKVVVPHNCEKSLHQTIQKRTLREKLKENAATPCAGSGKDIFFKTTQQYSELSTSMTFKSAKSTILRAKGKTENKSLKNEFSSVEEFSANLMEVPSFSKCDSTSGITMTAVLVQSSIKFKHLMLFAEDLVKEFSENNDIFVDATYKISPKVTGVTQVLTVMCKKYQAVVPCIWILMTNRTANAYVSIWEKIKELFPLFAPLKAHCDFEKALMKSLKNSFDNISVIGCYFHFTQAIVRKAKSKEYRLFVKENSKKNPHGNEIIKKINVLPLLPPEKIVEALGVIKCIIEEKFEEQPIIRKKWLKFIHFYFLKEWVKTITPAVFSVFLESDRTNNYVESYHRTLNATIRPKPCCSVFINGIIALSKHSIEDLERAKKKMSITSTREKTRLRDEAIQSVWMDIIKHPEWPAAKFVNELSGYENNQFEVFEQEEDPESVPEPSINDSDDDDEDEIMDYLNFSYTDCMKTRNTKLNPQTPNLQSNSSTTSGQCTVVYVPEIETPKKTATKTKKVVKRRINTANGGNRMDVKNTKLSKIEEAGRPKRMMKKKIDDIYAYFPPK